MKSKNVISIHSYLLHAIVPCYKILRYHVWASPCSYSMWHLPAHLFSPAVLEAARWAIMAAHGYLISSHSSCFLPWGLLAVVRWHSDECKLERTREFTSARSAAFGWWRTDICWKQSPCPWGVENTAAWRSQEDRVQVPSEMASHRSGIYSFPFPLSGAAFWKWITNQQILRFRKTEAKTCNPLSKYSQEPNSQ